MPDVERETIAGIGSLNLRWAESFVAALCEAGVREAVIAPGSRSAPLALALHRAAPRIRTHVALDERAGSFFALGLAKATGMPAAVLCTSGTAAANFHPALLEARHARVPLIALTADRPPELRDTGAPQTVDQIKLYGGAVRWFSEVGVPSPDPESQRYVASLGARAVRIACGPPAGPVHLNFPFREPLLPVPADAAVSSASVPGAGGPTAGAAGSTGARGTIPTGPPEEIEPSVSDVERCARLLRGRRRGLILCGPDTSGSHPSRTLDAVLALSEATGYPILADPLSGLRYVSHRNSGSPRVLGAYDAFLRAPRFLEGEAPEAIVQLGAAPTSKALARYRDRFPSAARIAADVAGESRDPSRRTLDVVPASASRFARALAAALARSAEPLASWSARFAAADRAAADALARGLERAGDTISESGLFPALLRSLPEEALLFAGNSMPVRDLDAFAPSSPDGRAVSALGNRGVNGIDGVLSAALGVSAGAGAPVLVVLGDLSFLHDMNGLAALREGAARAVIVVVNNDGGGIFSLLPVAEHADVFERYFGTPHGLGFEHAAALYGLPYFRPRDLSSLADTAGAALREGRTSLIEIRTNRAAEAAHRRALLAEALRAVEAMP